MTKDGKTLEETINDLMSENSGLRQRVEQLEKEGTGQKPLTGSGITPLSDAVTKEEHKLLKQRMLDLEDKIANLKVGGNDIDLTKEFSAELLSLDKTDLE